MNSKKPSFDISIVPQRNIVRSEGYGVWTVDITNRNREEIKKAASKFAGKKWALMGVIPKLAPIVDAEVSKAFARFHDEFEKMGCAAFAFVVGGAVAIKAQAQRHHDTSSATKLVVNHFRTEEQALDWLKTMGI